MSDFIIEVPLVRVYYNTTDSPPCKRWSLDFGWGTPEILVNDIQINCEVNSKLDIDDSRLDPKYNPRGWFEISDARLEFTYNNVTIIPITSPDSLEEIQVDWGELRELRKSKP